MGDELSRTRTPLEATVEQGHERPKQRQSPQMRPLDERL